MDELVATERPRRGEGRPPLDPVDEDARTTAELDLRAPLGEPESRAAGWRIVVPLARIVEGRSLDRERRPVRIGRDEQLARILEAEEAEPVGPRPRDRRPSSSRESYAAPTWSRSACTAAKSLVEGQDYPDGGLTPAGRP
jgi:hypothetical protein